MARIRLEIELEYDADLMYHDDAEGRAWFFDHILGDEGALVLHSNEIGDDIGPVTVIRRIL